jgi:hypothetical protein
VQVQDGPGQENVGLFDRNEITVRPVLSELCRYPRDRG